MKEEDLITSQPFNRVQFESVDCVARVGWINGGQESVFGIAAVALVVYISSEYVDLSLSQCGKQADDDNSYCKKTTHYFPLSFKKLNISL